MNSLLQRSLHGPAIYNPDLLSKDELVRGFVARQDLLRLLVDDLRRVASGSGVQHHLLLGQRGMGKTTLLRRLRYAVDDDPELREAWLPLIFPEEQYDIARLSDFYLNCIDALSDALEDRGETAAARALDNAVAAIPKGPEKTRADRALELLISTATRRKARLLLLLDNIDLLFQRLAGDDWTLRELLSSQDRLCVVGASAAAIETTYSYGKAFYDFFQVHTLGGLSEAECREVLLTMSRMFGTPQVEQWITQEPSRLRALRLLTGGNPRTVALLHTVAASSAEGDVRSDLERLLDQCTPLYKHRFESLPDQAQRVVHALALHWQPASAADIAEATRLDVNAASSQLARLVNDGVVEKVPFVPETKTGFQIAERFFNIWYLMRSSRRVRRRLVWLVEFLKMFYEGEELGTHARHALRSSSGKGHDGAIRFAESALAFAEAVEDEPLRKALEGAAAYALTVLPDVRAKLAAIVDLDGDDAVLKPAMDRHKAAAEIRERVLAAKVSVEGWDAEEFADLLGGSMSLMRADKERLARDLEQLTASRVHEFICIWREEIDTWESWFGPNVTDLLRRAFQDGYVEDFTNCDTLDAAAIAMDAPLLHAFSSARRSQKDRSAVAAERLRVLLPPDEMSYGWEAYGRLLQQEGQRELAERAFRKAVELGDPFGIASQRLGTLLAENPERLDDAEVALRMATTAPKPGSTQWKALAKFLAARRERYDESSEAYRQALALEPRDAQAWNALGNILLNHLRRPDEAERAYREAAQIDGNQPGYWLNLARTLVLRPDQDSETESAIRAAIGLRDDNVSAWGLLELVLRRQGRNGEAIDALRRLTELDRQDVRSRNSLAWSLYLADQSGDEAERAARDAVRLDPSSVWIAHTAATILARRGHWTEARALADRFLKEGSAEFHAKTWEDILLFFQEAVRSGNAADAGALLDETELGERWLPLREALRILAADNRLLLRKLAPEVREPTRILVDRLAQPAPPPEPGTAKPDAAPIAKSRSSKRATASTTAKSKRAIASTPAQPKRRTQAAPKAPSPAPRRKKKA